MGLPNFCLFNFYIQILTLIKNEVTKIKKEMPEYQPIINKCLVCGEPSLDCHICIIYGRGYTEGRITAMSRASRTWRDTWSVSINPIK